MFARNLKALVLAGLAVTALGLQSPANAAYRAERPRRESPPNMHFDSRFSHNQFYHDRGYAVPGIPRGAVPVHYRNSLVFFHGGEWYRRTGGFSVVIGAPIGAFVPVLPPFYSTVVWAGVPYYYADDAYYAWRPAMHEYEVVAPPAGIEDNGTATTTPSANELFIYPKNGQSAEQQARDRYECYRSAVLATGFDPTVTGGGVPPDTTASKRSDYLRAESACLDARGYSVK